MKKSKITLLFSLFLLSSFGCYFNVNVKSSSKKELDTEIIVALKESNNYDNKKIKNIFINELTNKLNFNYRIKDSYEIKNNYLYLSINNEDLSKVKSLNTVKYAYEEVSYSYEDFDPNDPTYLYNGNNEILTTNYSKIEMNIDDSLNNGENTLVAILDTSLNYDHEIFTDLKDTSNIRYNKTDIDNIINNNDDFIGKDYRYVNNKIVFTYDYYSLKSEVRYKSIHGSHVTSLSTANNTYKGIAPLTQVAFMKVFNNSGTGSASHYYLKALQDCYLLKVDAINLSLGSALINTKISSDLAVSEVLSDLKEEGINVFIAAGNDGKDYFDSSNYEYSTLTNIESNMMGILANENSAITVGNANLSTDKSLSYGLVGNLQSIELYERSVTTLGLNSSTNEYEISKFNKEYRFNDLISTNKEYEYELIPNYGSNEDYLNIDIKDKIALVSRGTLTFVEKIYNAINNGAKGLIIGNQKEDSITNFSYQISDEILTKYPNIPYIINDKGIKEFDRNYISIPVALVTYDSFNILKNSEVKSIKFFKESMSHTSSMGGSASLELKPNLVAPGNNIYGAYASSQPIYNTEGIIDSYSNTFYYTYMSGTSMASPNLMGAYIDILSSYDLNNLDRKNLSKTIRYKMNSSTTLLKDEFNNYITPRREGNGLINAKKAFDSTSFLYFYNNKSKTYESNIELYNNDDIKNGIINFDVLINEEKESETYQVKLDIMAPKISEITFNNKKVKLTNSDDTLLESVSLGSFVTKNGENTLSINKEINETSKNYLTNFTSGCYLEGYLTLTSKNNELHIPFMGFYGDYDAQSPYEEFDFEKDDDTVYESDLLDTYIHDHYKKNDEYMTYFNSSSLMLMGGDETYYRGNILSNSPDYTLKNSYRKMEYIYDSDDGYYHIYTGDYTSNKNNKGITIQLFMKRSVISNSISLINSDNETVLLSQFKDSNVSSSYVGEGELYRNVILPQQGIYTHRTYYFLDLVKSSQWGYKYYKDGVYRLEFSFTLLDGYVYNKTYILHLGSSYVGQVNIYDVTLKNNILRIYIKDLNITSININNNDYDLKLLNKIDNLKQYLELDISLFNEDIFIEINNIYLNSTYFKYFIDENVFIAGKEINNDIDLSIETRNESSNYIYLYNDKEHTSLFYLDNNYLFGFKKNTFNKIYGYEDYKLYELEFINEENNELYLLESTFTQFVEEKEVKIEDLTDNFLPLIISLSAVLFVILVASTSIFIVIKVKRNKK